MPNDDKSLRLVLTTETKTFTSNKAKKLKHRAFAKTARAVNINRAICILSQFHRFMNSPRIRVQLPKNIHLSIRSSLAINQQQIDALLFSTIY